LRKNIKKKVKNNNALPKKEPVLLLILYSHENERPGVEVEPTRYAIPILSVLRNRMDIHYMIHVLALEFAYHSGYDTVRDDIVNLLPDEGSYTCCLDYMRCELLGHLAAYDDLCKDGILGKYRLSNLSGLSYKPIKHKWFVEIGDCVYCFQLVHTET